MSCALALPPGRKGAPPTRKGVQEAKVRSRAGRGPRSASCEEQQKTGRLSSGCEEVARSAAAAPPRPVQEHVVVQSTGPVFIEPEPFDRLKHKI